MQKISLRPIPSKQIIYEENFSIDQTSFNSHLSPPQNTVKSPKNEETPLQVSHISFNSIMMIANNLQLHNSSITDSYYKLQANILINKKKSHLLTCYREMKISISESNVLKRFYTLSESLIRIPKFEQYYKHYMKFLANPILVSQSVNILLHENARQKAQNYFDMAYGHSRKKGLSDPNQINKINEDIIFDSEAKETIENYSTTFTCDYSNEQQLLYPYDILRSHQGTKPCDGGKKPTVNEFDFSESEIGINANNNKSSLFIQNDGENESIWIIMKDLKNKSQSKDKAKPKEKLTYKEQHHLNAVKYTDVAKKKRISTANASIHNHLHLGLSGHANASQGNNTDKKKKISFISVNNNAKQEKKYYSLNNNFSTMKKKIANKSQSLNLLKSKFSSVFISQQIGQLQHSTQQHPNLDIKNYASSYRTKRRYSQIEKMKSSTHKKADSNTCTNKNSKYINEIFSATKARENEKEFKKRSKSKSPIKAIHKSLHSEVKEMKYGLNASKNRKIV